MAIMLWLQLCYRRLHVSGYECRKLSWFQCYGYCCVTGGYMYQAISVMSGYPSDLSVYPRITGIDVDSLLVQDDYIFVQVKQKPRIRLLLLLLLLLRKTITYFSCCSSGEM